MRIHNSSSSTSSSSSSSSDSSSISLESSSSSGSEETPSSSTSSSDEYSDEWKVDDAAYQRHSVSSPYYLTRTTNAVPTSNAQRVNARGYDMDNPEDAIKKYEAAHPETVWDQISNFFSSTLVNIATLGIPKLLSASAGENKQRIDQKVILRITREAVDKFPELKLRMSEGAFEPLSADEKRQWHMNKAIIRAAQHDYIANELAKVYPNHINLDAPTFLYTGGRAVGLLRVLYCSMDEYVAIYWNPWGFSGTDSGAYSPHVFDYIIEGQNVNWNARYLDYNPQDYEVTEPGEYTFLGTGDRKIWEAKECGMIDHAVPRKNDDSNGTNIMRMLDFATASNRNETKNWHAIGELLSTQMGALASEYTQRLKETLGIESEAMTPISRVTEEELRTAKNYFVEFPERMFSL